MRKHKRDDKYEEINNKIRKIEARLDKSRRSRRIISSESNSSDSDNDMASTNTSLLIANMGSRLNQPDENKSNPTPGPSSADNQSNALSPAPASPIVPVSSDAMAESQDPEIDEEMLALLGDAPIVDNKFGKATHKELASRWQEILSKGLQKESKDKILQEYLIPENCDLLVAPVLNPEIKAALSDQMVKRDLSILSKQKQVGIAVAAINQAIVLSLAKESHTKILKSLSDACRLLCDTHFNDTKTRRGFVISAINVNMKDALADTKRDKQLFGENISEKLKAAKYIQKSGSELKQQQKSQVFNKNNFLKSNRNSNNNRLNSKTLPRKTGPKYEAGKPRPSLGYRAAPNSSQHRGTSDQSAPRSYKYPRR